MIRIVRATFLALTISGCGLSAARAPSQLQQEWAAETAALVGKHMWLDPVIPVEICSAPGSPRGSCPTKKSGGFRIAGTVHAGGNDWFDLRFDDGSAGYVDWPDKAYFVDHDPQLRARRAADECQRRGQPQIGMTIEQVKASCWGPPLSTNRMRGVGGTHDQLIYPLNRYLYLENGTVSAIQEFNR